MTSPMRATICGASPSDGSSSSSRRGPGHQGAADREHLLLAARQQARPLPRALGEHGEQLVHPVPGLVRAAGDRAPRPPARRFSSTVMRAKTCRPSGTCDDAAADDQRRVEPVDAVAVEGDLARGHRAPVQPEGARDRAQQRRLARAVAAEHRQDAVSGDGEGDVLQRADGASVPHRQPADLEHAAVRRHAVHHTALDSSARRGGNQTDTTPLSAGLTAGPLRRLLIGAAGPRIGGNLAVAVANHPPDDETHHRGEAYPASSHDEDPVQRGDVRWSFRFSYRQCPSFTRPMGSRPIGSVTVPAGAQGHKSGTAGPSRSSASTIR